MEFDVTVHVSYTRKLRLEAEDSLEARELASNQVWAEVPPDTEGAVIETGVEQAE